MSTAVKLTAYGLVLAVALGGGAALGAAVGPIDVTFDDVHSTSHGPSPAAPASPTALGATGLAIADGGYRLVADDRLADPGPFRFAIVDADGAPVRDFEEVHDKKLHLIVASRDLRQFAHLHPSMDDDGRWSVDLPVLPAGAYRAFADFQPTGGPALTLGVDLVVPGAVEAAPALSDTTLAEVGEFAVALDGALVPGEESVVTVTVRRGGDVVTTEPYLGAAGHLVALRDGDLAYLHVHPLDDEPAGPVRFAVEAPSAGDFGLFFDFVVDGQVHTARFVLTAEAADDAAGDNTPTTTTPPAGHGSDHDH